MERTQKKSMWFLLMVIAVVYVLVSIALAVSTVDKCGDESADKHWAFIPPQWECESTTRFSP